MKKIKNKVEKSEKAENVEPPQAVADETVTKTASPQVPAAADRADGFTCDQLTSGCTVVLSGTPEFFQSLKKELSAEINIALLEAAGLGSYKTQLQQIIKAKPALVIIEISQKFAENSISIATFENLIWFYSSALRENAIPLAFVLSAESEDDQSVVKFNQAVIKLCQLHSIPIISNINDRTGMAEFIRKMTTQNQ